MRWRKWRGVLIAGALGLAGSVASADPADVRPADEPVVSPAPAEPEPTERAELVEPEPDEPGTTPPIENAGALAPFFRALAGTERGEGLTRVTHLGDSSIGMDALPHGLRRRFQERFGDGGAGFLLLTQPAESYTNRTVRVRESSPWTSCVVVRRCRPDGHYGLGGVTAEARGRSSTTIEPRDGRRVSRAELWYLAQPRGGRLQFELGEASVEIDTAAEALEDRWHVLEGPEGDLTARVRTLGGRVRAYGMVLENDGPGVVWDSLPMVGAFTRRVLAYDEAHFARQLARRDPDLVVLSYGGNDLRGVVHGLSRERLQEETEQVLARVRAAVPDSACLLVGVSDHTASGLAAIEPRHVQTVIDAQRAAAERSGCAFWDQVAAMGGGGSFRTWHRRGLTAGDGKHLSARGREVIAARLHAALMHARQ